MNRRRSGGVMPAAMVVSVRERWNHNNHYHDRLLRELPPALDCALDVGCGHGFFAARLADRASHVDAVDVDGGVVAEAERLHGNGRVTFRAGDFLALGLPAERYDAVTSIAALHHMDLVAALREMRRVLRPGGRLALVGLYRARTPADYAAAVLAIAPSWIRTHLRDPPAAGALEMTAPARPPQTSLRDIRAAAAAELPGARVDRHLYWRYSLCWRKT